MPCSTNASGQADALDALPVQGPVVDEEFQHGGREASGKGVFLGEQDAVKAACHIEKLLFRKGLIQRASNTATLRPVSAKSLSAAFCAATTMLPTATTTASVPSRSSSPSPRGGAAGKSAVRRWAGMAGSGAAGITDDARRGRGSGT